MDVKQTEKSDGYSFAIMAAFLLFDIRDILKLLYHPTDIVKIQISKASNGMLLLEYRMGEKIIPGVL